MAIWIGGFTFYSAAVIPVLHGAMSHREAGEITRRVTDRLNLVGAATVVLWMVLAVIGRRAAGPRGARIARGWLLGLTIAILGFLFVLHGAMDRRLDAGLMSGFYPWHRVYLIASTIQWAVNLSLLGLSFSAREPR